MIWANPSARVGLSETDPELLRRVDSLSFALRAHNMLAEAKEIGLSVDVSALDTETVHLVYLIKQKLRAREERKSAAKTGGAKRRGRR